MIKKITFFSFLFILLYMPHAFFAETITLNTGRVIEGEILNATDEYIEILTNADIILKYYYDEIRSGFEKPNVFKIIAEEPVNIEPVLPQKTNTNKVIEEVVQKKISEVQNFYESIKTKVDNNESIQTTKGKIVKTLTLNTDKLREQLKISLNQNQIKALNVVILKWNSLVDLYFSTFHLYPKNIKYLICGIIYVLICFPLMLISIKMKSGLSWLALIIPFQPYILVRMCERPFWWTLLFFIPGVNIIIYIILWINVGRYLQYSMWMGFGMIIPGVNFFVLWYIALSSNKPIFEKMLTRNSSVDILPSGNKKVKAKVFIPKSKESRL